MARFIQRFLRSEAGATAVEYGLIAAMISIVVLTAVQLLRDPILALFARVGIQLDGAGK